MIEVDHQSRETTFNNVILLTLIGARDLFKRLMDVTIVLDGASGTI